MQAIVLAILISILAGCQVIGPGAIRNGRINYNAVIHMTNAQQLFENILYVNNYQIPEFMDVTEIDALVLSSASLSGGESAIGIAHAGTVSGTLQYQESPTIRYTPLYGQALVSQIASPITVTSLSDIINSGWPIATVLDFALNRLALTAEDHYTVIDIIERLWFHDAIIIGTGISEPKNDQGSSKESNQHAPSGSSKASASSETPADSLVIYISPFGLKNAEDLEDWRKLLMFYAETPADIERLRAATPSTIPRQLILRNGPTHPVSLARGAPPISPPLIRTRSALGILKAATTGVDHLIAFVSIDQYQDIHVCHGKEKLYYQLNKLADGCGYYRKYMLIIKSPILPPNTYVSNFDAQSGLYYYIQSDDHISQETFALLGLFMIVQAAPGPPPLTPTISVGG